MIRFNEQFGEAGPILQAVGSNGMDSTSTSSGELGDEDRRQQARLLIDTAALLLDGDDEYAATVFPLLHVCMDLMPGDEDGSNG